MFDGHSVLHSHAHSHTTRDAKCIHTHLYPSTLYILWSINIYLLRIYEVHSRLRHPDPVKFLR